MRNHVREILKLAKAIIQQGWCRNSEAKTRRGDTVEPTDELAERFCAVGAIKRATKELKYNKKYWVLSKKLLDDASFPYEKVEWLNDATTSKKKVLDVFDSAIKMA